MSSQPLHTSLAQLVAEFKVYLKKQKEISNQFSKFTDTNFKEVSQTIATQCQVRREIEKKKKINYYMMILFLPKAVSIVSSQIQKDSQTTSFLKQEISLVISVFFFLSFAFFIGMEAYINV